jgi:hypothetical protein
VRRRPRPSRSPARRGGTSRTHGAEPPDARRDPPEPGDERAILDRGRRALSAGDEERVDAAPDGAQARSATRRTPDCVATGPAPAASTSTAYAGRRASREAAANTSSGPVTSSICTSGYATTATGGWTTSA